MITRRFFVASLLSGPVVAKASTSQPFVATPCPVCGVRDDQPIGLVVEGEVDKDGEHKHTVVTDLTQTVCGNCGVPRFRNVHLNE